jgi:hypothetical protein
MSCGVYEIKNLESNQSYIGRSLNIENRWEQHKKGCLQNRKFEQTRELMKNNPDMVEFNILYEIDSTYFNRDELLFIMSVKELEELDKRGGINSDEILNANNGCILKCPLSILNKIHHLPSFVTEQDILAGLAKYVNFFEETFENGDLSKIIEEKSRLDERVDFYENMSGFLDPKDKMWVKFIKLVDEFCELKATLNYWKQNSKEWRDKYIELVGGDTHV